MNDLYRILDIDEPVDFQYFENIAALLECEEELEYGELVDLFKNLDLMTVAEIIDEYFEDLTNHIPGSEAEIFTILENVHLALVGMARNVNEDEIANLVDELERFRKWYSIESKVYCSKISSEEEECVPVRDAIVLARLENLDGEKYYYDFSGALDYQMDDYIMSFKDMIALSDDEDDTNYYLGDDDYERDYEE